MGDLERVPVVVQVEKAVQVVPVVALEGTHPAAPQAAQE
jgi:hypothetical protein